MIAFWIAVSFMISIALLFLLLPILQSPKSNTIDPDELSRRLYQQRLHILNTELAGDEITLSNYRHLRLELEKSVLAEIPRAESKPKKIPEPTHAWGLTIFFLVALPLVSLWLYSKLGAGSQLSAQYAAQHRAKAVQVEMTKLGSVQNVITTLAAHLQAHPDARGWFLLGKLYLKEQNYGEAVKALQEANRLQPQQPETLVAYAEALFFFNHRVLTAQGKRVLAQVLSLQPQQPEALNLLAVAAYQAGDYSQAAHYWQQLLSQYASDSEDGQILLRMIADAQQKANHKKSAGVASGS